METRIIIAYMLIAVLTLGALAILVTMVRVRQEKRRVARGQHRRNRRK